jgi:hypothetical protein
LSKEQHLPQKPDDIEKSVELGFKKKKISSEKDGGRTLIPIPHGFTGRGPLENSLCHLLPTRSLLLW